MNPYADPAYRQERSDTFDRILKHIDDRISEVPLVLATNLHAVSPTSARNGADRDCWQLLRRGVAHLKDGAPGGEPGSLSGAVEKACIRASSFASGIGVKTPAFENAQPEDDFATGREEALYMVRSMLVSITEDLPKSQQVIGAKMAQSDMSQAFGASGPLADPELRAIFAAVQKSTGAAGPEIENGVSKDDVADLRKQAVVSFNALLSAFKDSTANLSQTLDTLPTHNPRPKPPSKGQSFDF